MTTTIPRVVWVGVTQDPGGEHVFHRSEETCRKVRHLPTPRVPTLEEHAIERGIRPCKFCG